MSKQKKNPLPVSEADVISAGELTGSIPLPPLDSDSYQAYKELLDFEADAGSTSKAK